MWPYCSRHDPHSGWLEGFGIAEGDPQIVCEQPSFGDLAKGQTAIENCLQKAPGIDVVFTVNEPTAAGVRTALTKARGKGPRTSSSWMP